MSENTNRFSQDPEAVKARALAAAKSRAESKSKDDLIEVVQPLYSKIAGTKISKQDAWKLFKLSIKAPIEIARQARLSLAGIGSFEILTSKRSEVAGKAPLRPKFRPSTSLIEVVNSKESLLEEVEQEAKQEVQPDAPESESAKSEPVNTSAAPAEDDDLL